MLLFYLTVALQTACAYHVYTSKSNTYWYYVIVLIPGIGAAIYLLAQAFRKDDLTNEQKEVTRVVKSTKKFLDLEKKIEFSDTFQNRINLADALQKSGNYADAELQYQEALAGNHTDDYYANTQLLTSLFQQDKFEEVIAVAERIYAKPDFEGSRGQFLYGLALYKTGKDQAAEEILKKVNKRYTNYSERLELAKFYIENKKNQEATEILEEMKIEYLILTQSNKLKYKSIFSEVNTLVVPS